MNLLVTICARAGSKGVKNKNLRPLAGVPLISHTIRLARDWNAAARCVVSTDSEQMREIALSEGVDAPFLRPANLAEDDTPKLAVIRHACETAESVYRESYDIIVDLDVTAPLRRTADLDRCLEIFLERKPLSLFSVTRARKNPYFNMVEEDSGGWVKLVRPPGEAVVSRQTVPRVFDMNASIYFYDASFLKNPQVRGPLSERSLVYEMPEVCAVDIDTEQDFQYVEWLIEKGYFCLETHV